VQSCDVIPALPTAPVKISIVRLKLLDVLACPECLGELTCAAQETTSTGEIESGTLGCRKCAKQFSIREGIPRFVESDNYSASFGYQWNRFRAEQIDSINGTRISEQRFYQETSWTTEWLKGKWILDAGCGAGRFLDVAAKADAEVVGLDLSSAVDAAAKNLADRKNVHLVQASIYQLPFREGSFDGCYCIGVVQHTPDPQRTLRTLPCVLRSGGRIAITAYERKPWTKLYAKYWLRPFTKRINKQTLLSSIQKTMPVLFPLTDVLFRAPLVGRLFTFAIPVANYVREPALMREQRYNWAILDTFDMLSPEYDLPRTQEEVEQALSEAGVRNLQRISNAGLTITGKKDEAPPTRNGPSEQ
jgi:2-polyprenyl-3-methyl-5-hydroxy-6-metoxy-1,4-benzoquinol methylase